MADGRARTEQDYRDALERDSVVPRVERIVLSWLWTTLKGEGAVAGGQGAAREPEKPVSIRVWDPSRFEAETSLQHGDV